LVKFRSTQNEVKKISIESSSMGKWEFEAIERHKPNGFQRDSKILIQEKLVLEEIIIERIWAPI